MEALLLSHTRLAALRFSGRIFKMIGQQPPPKNAARADGWVQRWRTPGICLALAAITFAVFGQTLRHQFVNFDDDLYVYDNPMVARGLTSHGIVWAFTHVHSVNWHPLTWLSHELDCQLYGLNPAGHHLTNVLLHTATVIALFLVLGQMTGAFWRSAFVAAVFAIHPLRVESVAWVAERKDVLSGLFFMLTIGAYVRYAKETGRVRLCRTPDRSSHGSTESRPTVSKLRALHVYYCLALLLFALGLLCKPMLVTLPLVLLLLDYWPLQRVESAGRLVLEKLPLLALSAAVCVVTLLAQNTAIHSGGSFSLPYRLGNALAACLVYLGQMVWPAGLAALYPFPHNGVPAWEVALAGTLLAGLSAVAWGERRTRPWLLMGWVWYLVMLLPVLGIIQVGRQAHADRYTYLPQIGIYVAVTWLVAEWGVRWLQPGQLRVALGGLMAAVLAVLMVCAWKQSTYWQDSETLWTRALACATDNDMARNNLGNALYQKGRVDEAITQYQRALQIRPDSAGAHYDLGFAMFQRRRVDEAISQFQEALKTQPNFEKAHFQLGNALREKGRVDEAISHYQRALQIQPDFAEAHNNLGTALRQKGRVDEAISHYQKALAIMPDNEPVHVNLANALLQKGRVDQAIVHYQKALQIDPADMEIENNLAWLLATAAQASLRNGDKAVQLARRANELAGGKNPVILGTLAAAFAEAGRFPEAMKTAQRALHLAEAQSNTRLAGQLQLEMKLYQAGSPFHIVEQTH
jgi:tetratricopeptide (TPR) repeat protein